MSDGLLKDVHFEPEKEVTVKYQLDLISRCTCGVIWTGRQYLIEYNLPADIFGQYIDDDGLIAYHIAHTSIYRK